MELKDLIINNLEVPASVFCRQINISRQTYTNIINNSNNYARKDKKSYKPRLFIVKKICNYFGVDFKDYI